MSNQSTSKYQRFFSPRQVNLKISHRILPNPSIPEDDLPRLALIPEDDLPSVPARKDSIQAEELGD
jgi:hypothetical protein